MLTAFLASPPNNSNAQVEVLITAKAGAKFQQIHTTVPDQVLFYNLLNNENGSHAVKLG